MRTIVAFLLSQSILLPIITGLVNFRRLDGSYQPFFLLLIIGFLTEVIGFITISGYGASNFIIVNIYLLIEWTLIAWQFHVWGFLRHNQRLFYGLLILMALGWAVENLLFHRITGMVVYFRFLYFFIIVLLSINKINFMITHENRNLFRNPRFLICIGFIIYFLYMIVYIWAFAISFFGAEQITRRITFFMSYINVLTNIIYAIAFLLIPKPLKFTLN
ncbi:MAG: hypothetical protein J0H74_16575 [Chitinophagaceae bacterium]|nr:hypothetical protein [Chitinophagaceae bacterium]